MNLVEDYWAGVLRRLQAEVDGFNRLIWHQGEKGRENEQSLSRVIENLVPSRFGVGSGLVFDADGNQSKQMDIIIYDRADEPSMLAQTTQLLFPVENVRACIEVKTTVDKDEIGDIGKKRESIRALKPRGSVISPYFAALAFSSSVQAKTAAQHVLELGGSQIPDVFCVLDIGLLVCDSTAWPPDSPGATIGKHVAGVTPLRVKDGGTLRRGEYREPPPLHSEARISIDGSNYPIVDVPGRTVVGEPSRALLLFCEALNAGIIRTEKRVSTLSHYITAETRDILLLN